MDEHTTVEHRNGLRDAQRVDQHLHAEWRAAAGDSECYIRIPKVLHRFNGARGQHLVLGEQCAIDIGDDQANIIPHIDLKPVAKLLPRVFYSSVSAISLQQFCTRPTVAPVWQ